MSTLNELHGAHGTVALSNWGRDPYGRAILVVAGQIYFHTTEGALSFRPSSKDSNWFVEVRGKTERYFIPGCQVCGVSYHEPKDYSGRHFESGYLVP